MGYKRSWPGRRQSAVGVRFESRLPDDSKKCHEGMLHGTFYFLHHPSQSINACKDTDTEYVSPAEPVKNRERVFGETPMFKSAI